MKTISAHITSFYHSTFHAYTTEVNVDGHRWRLGLRYSKFHDFYDQLMLKTKDFHASFPPKGTLFFTPKPEERQKQLEEFLQQVLVYYSNKGRPTDIEDLLCDLLKVPHHLRRDPEHDDDNVSTSTESVLSEPVHEPLVDSVAVEAVEEERKVTATSEPEAGTKNTSAVVLGAAEEVPVEKTASEARTNKEEEAVAALKEPKSLTVEETLPPKDSQLPVVYEDVQEHEDVEAVTMSTDEINTVKQGKVPVEDDTVESDTADQDVVESPSHVPIEEIAEKVTAEDIPGEMAKEAEAVVDSTASEPEYLVTDPVPSKTETIMSKPQAIEAPAKDSCSQGENKLGTRKRVSTSWLEAYLPKPLLGFIRHRCMKKTNLVMLCVAILLPMVLARR
ncbi:hypothetical protein PHYBOEH_000533 [Phytophthora boehmeriae]|uniref:PX domain-containing protein n=1 Tax=Phytophthora boehmeriae TaxID=109152 RepID=A0A8T1X1B8_9STRA|nr:hypothetical protein PHYBOEH_000533 [Phytophthora boehmeriae]